MPSSPIRYAASPGRPQEAAISQDIHGNTSGLKAEQRRALERLYRRRVPAHAVSTLDLNAQMAEISADTGRQIGVIVDRKGHVQHVIVGDAHKIELPDLGRHRAGRGRLRGVRLLHTHLQHEPLTRDDLTDLALLRLDYVAALEVHENGRPGRWFAAHVLPENEAGDLWHLFPPRQAHEVLGEVDFDAFIRDLESRLAGEARIQRVKDRPRAVLVQVATPDGPDPDISLQELRELSGTAGVEVVDEIIQRRARLDPRTCLGKGKLQDLTLRSMQLDAELAIFDLNLTPTQVRSIGEASDIKVIDRTQLILDIFAQRARTREGKLQVELAQLRYRLPRLTRGDTSAFSRLAGGIGGRGPGEQKLEIDRRRVKDRITLLEKELERVARSREVRRSRRERSQVPIISIVGYTNAGKSTLLNTLTDSEVLSENKLFATLDPTSRRLRFPREREVIITDTVGFIRDLPPDLVRAFRATLEELNDADLLLHVADASSPNLEDHVQTVDSLLEELELGDQPVLRVLNKVDRFPDRGDALRLAERLDAVPISAMEPASLRPLLQTIEDTLWQESGRSLDLPSVAVPGAPATPADEVEPEAGSDDAAAREAFWNQRYEDEHTPWDLGEPHPALLNRVESLGAVGRAFVPGCGYGHDALVLAGLGWDVTAVDLAPRAGTRVSETLRRTGGRFVAADALRHPFGEAQYDLWLDHTFLCALPPSERPAWGAQARRLVRPGGRLAAVVFPIEPITDDPPPYPISTSLIESLLGDGFRLLSDEPAERPLERDVPVRWALFERK